MQTFVEAGVQNVINNKTNARIEQHHLSTIWLQDDFLDKEA